MDFYSLVISLKLKSLFSFTNEPFILFFLNQKMHPKINLKTPKIVFRGGSSPPGPLPIPCPGPLAKFSQEFNSKDVGKYGSCKSNYHTITTVAPYSIGTVFASYYCSSEACQESRNLCNSQTHNIHKLVIKLFKDSFISTLPLISLITLKLRITL